MTRVVIDASSTLAWTFDDESGPDSEALIDKVAADGAVVPALWSLELANGLVVAERRGRISAAESATVIALIEQLPIVADPGTAGRALHETMSLAREHGLTAYVAAYLELAMRLGVPLATRDRRLAAAAQKAGVELVDTASAS